MKMKNALIVFQSVTGNTEKVANSIYEGLTDGGFATTLKKVQDATNEDFYNYDLVCFGSPSYNWHVPKQADEFLKAKFGQYKKEGRIVPGAPIIPGKSCLVFCTYSGPHTGIREAIPAGKYIGQFFEHFGFTVVDEWYVLSEFIGSEENNTKGRMGNIIGLPSEHDLTRIRESACNLAYRLL
jgi:multimeric flavodoxin WrbA